MNIHSKRYRILSTSSSSSFFSFGCRSDFRASMASKIKLRKSEKGDEDWFYSSSVTWAVVVVNWGKGAVVVGGG
ncbi:hypothetical protein ACFX2F_024965 [Malus domestica]